MKNNLLLKSFLALALVLIVTFSVQVYASEVVGNISSSNTQSGGSGGSEVGGTIDNGTIAGNVDSGGTSGSSRGGGSSAGTVLGVATTGFTPAPYYTFDSTSLRPSYRSVALVAATDESVDGSVLGAETVDDAPFVETVVDLDGSDGLSGDCWFWIILLILLILGLLTYIYSKRESRNRVR